MPHLLDGRANLSVLLGSKSPPPLYSSVTPLRFGLRIGYYFNVREILILLDGE